MPHSNWSKFAHCAGVAFVAASLAFNPASFGTTSASAEAQPASRSTNASLPDGVYLYGESSKPNQMGKGYFVFESKQGQVVGALYMPSSSFDCATGSFKDDQLALNVTNSYDRSTNPFEIALDRTAIVAGTKTAPIRDVGLQGFYKLDKVSAADQRFLKTCKADLQGHARR